MTEKTLLSLMLTDKTGHYYQKIETCLFSSHFKDPSLKEGFILLTNALCFVERDWQKKTWKDEPDDKERAKFVKSALKNIYKFKTTLQPPKPKDFWVELWNYGVSLRKDKTDEDIEALFSSALLSIL